MRLSSELLGRIAAHAAAEAGREVCGLLLGRGEDILAVVPAHNVAADPEAQFEVDPAILLATHRAARTGTRKVIGCYHSHPNGRAEPSPIDAASAEPGQIWLIAAAGAITGFLAGATGFTPLPIEVLEDGTGSSPRLSPG